MAQSSPRSLYDILQRLQHTEGAAVAQWAGVLGAAFNTPEFQQKHAAVVELYADCLVLIEAQKSTVIRDRYRRYAPSWWRAIMHAEHQWGNARVQVDAASLDILATFADSIEMGREYDPIPGGSLAKLKREVEASLTSLKGIKDVPQAIIEHLRAELEKVLWYIENVNLFGEEKAYRQAEQTIGWVARVISSHPKVGTAVAGVIAAACFVNPVVELAANSAEAYQGWSQVVQDVKEAAAVDELPPKEITTGHGDAVVVAGEVVSD